MKHLIVFLLAVFIPISAWAALGTTDTSVQKDRIFLKGTLSLENFSTHRVYHIQTKTGCTVREYVSPSGTVFGIAWQGPYIPDLKQLLGPQYQTYINALKAERMQHRGRRPLNISSGGLVVQMIGHMRSFAGRAYLPALLPQGIDISAVR